MTKATPTRKSRKVSVRICTEVVVPKRRSRECRRLKTKVKRTRKLKKREKTARVRPGKSRRPKGAMVGVVVVVVVAVG